MCNWGCDGITGSTENANLSSIFMTSLIPLIMRSYNTSSSAPSFQDIWINTKPGSKLLCQPIRFDFVKEITNITQSFVDKI